MNCSEAQSKWCLKSSRHADSCFSFANFLFLAAAAHFQKKSKAVSSCNSSPNPLLSWKMCVGIYSRFDKHSGSKMPLRYCQMNGGSYEDVAFDVRCSWDQFNIRSFKVSQKRITEFWLLGHVQRSSEVLCVDDCHLNMHSSETKAF